jgi:hypothetical protein
MKESSNKNATSILVLQGFVMHVGKGQTLISCPTSGRFDVRWRDNTMPDIKRGQYITLVGKLITLRLGESFMVVRAELLPAKSLKEIKKFIEERMERK